jgi:hypothetical protein
MRKKAELITKISLLKQKIDHCLDERNEEEFYRLTFELKICQRYLEACMNSTEIRYKSQFEQTHDKFFQN